MSAKDKYVVFCSNEIDPDWQVFCFDSFSEARSYVIDYMADMEGYPMVGQCFIYDSQKKIVVE